MRIPLRTSRPSPSRSASSSPFSHPMDLSFSEAPGPQRQRTGRAGGSHAPVDMSLGPLVKNGHLNTPYATVGIKGVSSDYGNEIDGWIRRHLYYPPDAAQRGEDGASHVHVVIDRSGHVKSARLVDSAGFFALDDSTTGMFRNATLPPVPDDMAGDHFDIDLTVNYILTH
jgi:TonB family protein